MERTDVNPWEWSKGFGFSQAIDLKGVQELLLCSGQTSVDDVGAPTGTDIATQVGTAMENLKTVLGQAGFTLDDVVKHTLYTTDVDGLLGAFGSATALMGSNQPAMTVIGVTRLAFPELMVEIEATAAR